MKVSSGGDAAVTLCGFSLARDGRDAANGCSTLCIASIAVQTAANSFLRPACAPYYEPQFRAAMMKRACHVTGERGSASKIISIAAGYGDGSSKVRL